MRTGCYSTLKTLLLRITSSRSDLSCEVAGLGSTLGVCGAATDQSNHDPLLMAPLQAQSGPFSKHAILAEGLLMGSVIGDNSRSLNEDALD